MITKILLSGLIFIVFIVLFRLIIKPSINEDEYYTSVAVIDNIEATISASGIVTPEFEEVKISPVQSRIIEVYHNTGDKVKNGDSILALDKRELQSMFDKLNDELSIKRNRVNQRKLQMEKSLIDIKTNYKIKKLQVENMTRELEEEKHLNNIGGGTKERIERAELNLKIANLELEQINQNIQNLSASMQADILGLNYEINIQENNIEELWNKLKHATITADKEGVITWINAQIGKNINQGEELVKLANLKSYEVIGNISDMHADKLNLGEIAIIRFNEDSEIRGEIYSISPSVSGNTIQFKVKLDNKDYMLLRPNLKVDVFVITSFRENSICIKNGAFYKGAAKQYVFIKHGDKLVKREAEFGESNFDYVEIISGINEGDEIVISDMTDYERHQEIRIKKTEK